MTRRRSRLVALALIAAGSLAVLAGPPLADAWRRQAWPFAFLSGSERVGSSVHRILPGDTPYEAWLEASQPTTPTFSGLLIQDVRSVPLDPWPAMGVDGLYIRMADYQIIDGWILEIPPGGSTASLRHMFEAGVYFFGGPGHTVLEQNGREPQRVDWDQRSLFSVPLNVRYRHVNDSDEPVRLVVVTSFPYVINSTGSDAFVWDNPFQFTDRYDGEPGFAGASEFVRRNRRAVNLVPDATEYPLDPLEVRGDGATSMRWSMAGNTMIDLHVSEIPADDYKRAHRHSSDAFILLLSGSGYSLTWPEDEVDRRRRVDWAEGTLFVPPIYWYHQHLNTGDEPARYLAINASVLVERLGLRFYDQLEPDLPGIEAEFAREVARRRSER